MFAKQRYIKLCAFLMVSSLMAGCLGAIQTKVSDVSSQLIPSQAAKVKTIQSDFDNSTQKLVLPGPVHRTQERSLGNLGFNAHFSLGGTWSSADPNRVILVALQIKLTRPFSRREGLQFNINGNVLKLNAVDYKGDNSQLRYFNERYNQRSLRFYDISKRDFERLVDDGKAKVKIFYSDGFYEGDLSIEKSQAAIKRLRALKTAINEG